MTVFISYASDDAPSAQRLAAALRQRGVEVWLDQSELRSGDAWDREIREQIRSCRLFVPLISAMTQARTEGYFRLEWKLAVDRSHSIAADRAFLVPVVIDGIPQMEARVPEEFQRVQWTRLPAGNAPPEFLDRLGDMLQGRAGTPRPARESRPAAAARAGWLPWGFVLIAGIVVLGMGFWRLRSSTREAAAGAPGAPAVTTVFSPPPRSIAVLPFKNLSDEAQDRYFSDGLSEDLLNTLASIADLRVAARTSSFLFDGSKLSVSDIARQLNVGAILEGSVRRSNGHIRVTAELINTVTGFQTWAQTFDRKLVDVLILQSDIAQHVTAALKVRLMSGGAETSIGGTNSAQAFDAFLRAEALMHQSSTGETNRQAATAYAQAIALDPNYARAYIGRAITSDNEWNSSAGALKGLDRALADARRAAELAPELGIVHAIIGHILVGKWEFAGASAEFDRGLALAAGDARVYGEAAFMSAYMGRFDEAVARARAGVTLDPLNSETHARLATVLRLARRYPEALDAAQRAVALHDCCAFADIGIVQLLMGDTQTAKTTCETGSQYYGARVCLAIANRRLGLVARSDRELVELRSTWGDAAAYQVVQIYSQWGDTARALDALERAFQLRDPGLIRTRVDGLLDPIRAERRFKAVLAHLNIPPVIEEAPRE